jgi:hypothetical protein|tara:strand:- start:42 stop:776 length:735 start_codon:yes stop_codon:yes gene_type:complete
MIIKNLNGVAAPSRAKMQLHDTALAPTGLWQFASGSLLTDSSGNSATLTQDSTHGAATPLGGIRPNHQANSDFLYYRNETDEYQYVGAMSVALMFKADSYAHSGGDNYYRMVMCGLHGQANGRFSILLSPTGHLYYDHKNSSTVYFVTLTDLHYDLYRWHHLALTRTSNGRTVTFYLDGEQIFQTTFAAAPGSGGTNNLCIGGLKGYNGGAYNNLSLSSVAIYDKELTATQVSELATHCLGVPS